MSPLLTALLSTHNTTMAMYGRCSAHIYPLCMLFRRMNQYALGSDCTDGIFALRWCMFDCEAVDRV